MLRTALVAAMVLPPLQAFAQDKPNVVLMLADNLGFGDLSSYNGGIRGEMRTPRIDELASEGVRLTQFLVEPGCTPSRAGLMTGRYSIRLGLSLIIAPGTVNTLQPGEITLGEIFKSVGYETAYAGKWHLDAGIQSQPQNQGFDKWMVGFSGTTDVVNYKANMRELRVPEPLCRAIANNYQIVAADGPDEPKRIRPYDGEYRRQIEGDIAAASVEYIKEQAAAGTPFFLMIGWTRPHFPNTVSEEFEGRSGVGTYGDSVVELDYRTGQVLDAIEEAGIEDNTIVIWISDNGPTKTGTVLNEFYTGSSGPFRGELGDAYEGSIRTAGMIKWPGRIAPSVTNEMFSIHDFFPTLAAIIGADVPNDRPIDGIDQSDFLLGLQKGSNRESLITFLGDRIIAVRWRQFRVYPVEIVHTNTNPSFGGYLGVIRETAGFPQIFNIESDPGEEVNIAHLQGWAVVPYLQVVRDYLDTLVQHPNPPAPNLVDFR